MNSRQLPSLFPFPNVSQAAASSRHLKPLPRFPFIIQLISYRPAWSHLLLTQSTMNKQLHGHRPLSFLPLHSEGPPPLFCLLKDSGCPPPPTPQKVGSDPDSHPSRAPVWYLPSCPCNDPALGAVSWWPGGSLSPLPGQGRASMSWAFLEPTVHNLPPPPLHPLWWPFSRLRFSKA